MGSGSGPNDPLIVSAFHSSLLHQSLVAALLLVAVLVVGRFMRSMLLKRSAEGGSPGSGPGQGFPQESPARRLLRLGFGFLWVFDGFLQGQASMPLGLVPGVIVPSAASSPAWVRHLVGSGADIWSYHPIQAAVAAVWIQLGIGLWLLVAPRGNWSRLAGVASAGWGLIVWVFGESFGGIFGQGSTWLFGMPGAALFYAVGGVLVALPEQWWSTVRPGRLILRGMGFFLLGMAVLQAWPGRGFWQGGHAGSLTAMVDQMAGTSQPPLLHSIVSSFASFDAAHGWAVNLFVVVVLAGIGLALMQSRPPIIRVGLVAATVFCLADWLLIEDLGFLGGVGTDPNSMIPMLVVLWAGYLALIRPTPIVSSADAPHSVRESLVRDPAYAFRSVAAVSAVAVTLMGSIPMLVLAPNRRADQILTLAQNGPLNVTGNPAVPFSLTDQYGRVVSLSSLRGDAVALTFLDPVCTNDCPVVAQEFKQADRLLGADASRVVMVAIDANPVYTSRLYLNAFDTQENLQGMANWRFLTGPLSQLVSAWRGYGIEVSLETGGGMVDHSFVSYVIDPNGESRYELDSNPGTVSSATEASFAQTLSSAIKQVLHS